MRIIQPSYTILTPIDGIKELQHIEKIARVCYKSEDKIDQEGNSARKIVSMLIKLGHEAMIEHSFLSVKFILDRGISHELVRHRIASFAQESTRYCNYGSDKFNHELTFIEPYYFAGQPAKMAIWKKAMEIAEKSYLQLLENGATAQQARAVLPNSLKTEITISANYREWRNIFKLRCAPDAHPQCHQIFVPLLKHLQEKLPEIFGDIQY